MSNLRTSKNRYHDSKRIGSHTTKTGKRYAMGVLSPPDGYYLDKILAGDADFLPPPWATKESPTTLVGSDHKMYGLWWRDSDCRLMMRRLEN